MAALPESGSERLSPLVTLKHSSLQPPEKVSFFLVFQKHVIPPGLRISFSFSQSFSQILKQTIPLCHLFCWGMVQCVVYMARDMLYGVVCVMWCGVVCLWHGMCGVWGVVWYVLCMVCCGVNGVVCVVWCVIWYVVCVVW